MSMKSKWPRVPIKTAFLNLFDGPHATPKPSESGPVFLGIKNISEDGHLDLSLGAKGRSRAMSTA